MWRWLVMVMVGTGLLSGGAVGAQWQDWAGYEMGEPVVTDIYVSPEGDDGQDGMSVETALRTVEAAWQRIPMGSELVGTGYRVLLMPGVYAAEDVPGYMEARYGTAEYPVIFEAAQGVNTAYLPSLNIYDVRYMYFLNINIEVGTDAFHCERCDHVLVRGSRFVGAEPETYNTQETVKVNQSAHIYFEGNDISGAWDNAVDFVAVQYGHFYGNQIHNAGDWCMYLKGGSAGFEVAHNRLYDCGTGGFTAGQGTGFQFMVEPWLQYEAYDIRFTQNVVHDTQGAGVGVQGGHNILIAENVFYRVGERSHVMEFGFGGRSCDGQPGDEGRERCELYREAGGWGNSAVADGVNYVRIPNRNVYVYNNVLYNPAGYQSGYQQFFIPEAFTGVEQADSNAPDPALADDNLQIRGNVIWNGGAEMPLGIEGGADFPAGCQMENPTCNRTQLLADNAINVFEPRLADPANGDYGVVDAGGYGGLAIPAFEEA